MSFNIAEIPSRHTSKFKTDLQRSHNLGKFPQICAVSMGVVLGIMRILRIPFKSLLFGNCSANSQPPSPSRNNDMEISCESAADLSKIGHPEKLPVQF